MQRISSSIRSPVNRPSATEPSASRPIVAASAVRQGPDEAVQSIPRWGRRAALVIVLAGVFYALLARFALEGYPYSGDEYSTVLQAEGFARGVERPQEDRIECGIDGDAKAFGIEDALEARDVATHVGRELASECRAIRARGHTP